MGGRINIPYLPEDAVVFYAVIGTANIEPQLECKILSRDYAAHSRDVPGYPAFR